MSLRDVADPTVRRTDDGLVYDAISGRLSLGAGSVSLAARGGNRLVLEAFVDLVGSCRGQRPGAVVELRDDDVDALMTALDLDAPDLLAQITSVLGTTTDQAIGILSRLQAHRILSGVAAAALVAVVTGGMVASVAGSSNGDVSSETRDRPATVEAATNLPLSPIDDPATPEDAMRDAAVVETPNGVGLVPAASIVRPAPDGLAAVEAPDGVGLIPAVTQDAGGAPSDPAGDRGTS